MDRRSPSLPLIDANGLFDDFIKATERGVPFKSVGGALLCTGGDVFRRGQMPARCEMKFTPPASPATLVQCSNHRMKRLPNTYPRSNEP